MVALRSTPVRGLETEWVDEGAGSAGRPVLFFIHGFPDDARVWEEQIAHFSKEYRVIAPQLRGAGGSSARLFVRPAVAWGDKPELGQSEIRHSAGGEADILAKLRRDRITAGAKLLRQGATPSSLDFPTRSVLPVDDVLMPANAP